MLFRAKALQLCGWNCELSALSNSLDRIEADGEYERAATIALFNLQLRRAIQTLNRGAIKAQGNYQYYSQHSSFPETVVNAQQ